MGELVAAITCLCKLLDCLISVSVKPDFFRLSKLNKLGLDQVQQMWNVLHKICCFSTKDTTCTNDSFKCIERCLRKQGGVTAYFLSPDATARQLLLSFGFLLSRRIIEMNIDKVLMDTPLVEELPLFMVNSDTTEDFTGIPSSPDENDTQTLSNYGLFLSGKVQRNLKAIANYSQEKAQLFYKIHKTTANVHGLPHLSVGDLLMTGHPEMQAQFLSKCQYCVPLLRAYSKWYRKRNVFWEWMVSVVEEEFKIKSKQQSVAEITHIHEFLRNLKSDVKKMTEVAQVSKDECSFEDSDMQVSNKRMCLGGNGQTLDSLIKNMSLEINNLQIGNENKMEEIKKNLLKTGHHYQEINSILEKFCAVEKRNKVTLTASGV